MIVERCTAEHFEDWVRLRQALWPDETIEEHRRYAASMVDRPTDAIVYLAQEEDGNIVAFAEATLRRDYVNGCSTSPVGFLEGFTSCLLIVVAGLRGCSTKRSKIGRPASVAPSSRPMSCCATSQGRERTKHLAISKPSAWFFMRNGSPVSNTRRYLFVAKRLTSRAPNRDVGFMPEADSVPPQ